MAQNREIAAIYGAAVIQGIVLVTFPAISTILTGKQNYGLSNGEYGAMFLPQAITAILASLVGTGLTLYLSGKWVLLLGLSADFFSMTLLLCSNFFMREHSVAYAILVWATAFLGIGFGFVVPALNTFTAAFFPEKADTAVLTLNALLGLGTALAPVFAILFVGLGLWWGLPTLMIACCAALLGLVIGLPLKDDSKPQYGGTTSADGLPARFWVYAGFALIYGICETLYGNWATVLLNRELASSETVASVALTVFWISVTGGRVFFALIEKHVPQNWTFQILPALLAIALLTTAFTPREYSWLAVVSVGIGGVGCSALLPLVISFAQRELTAMSASAAGAMIGFYQIGYGLAAFLVSPLQSWARMSLTSVFGWSSLLGASLVILAVIIVNARTTLRNTI